MQVGVEAGIGSELPALLCDRDRSRATPGPAGLLLMLLIAGVIDVSPVA